jgi:phage gpG-like protein
MIKIKGDKKLIANLKDFKGDLNSALDKAVMLVAFSIEAEAKKSIKQPSQGKAVKRGKQTHIQSLPGQAPNTDGGRLIGSVMTVGIKGKQTAFVGTNVEYGPILEFTHNRPWLEPAKNKKLGLFHGTIRKTVNEQIKQAGKI